MKRKINKEDFEKLSVENKAEYEEKNGNYFLKLEDEDDAIIALRQAKENESSSHKETKKQLKEALEKLNGAADDQHRKNGDVEALDKSWKEKFTARESELSTEISKYKNNLINSTKDNLLSGLANKIVKPDAQRIFKKSIEDRITVEFDGEKAVHRILDKEGKVSAMTMDDFEKEIVANKEYSSIIVASKASGSGGPDKPRIGAGGSNNGDKPVILSTLSPAEMVARINASKTS